jgi:hypothetical protein
VVCQMSGVTIHRVPALDGRLVLYVFDCCSESRDVGTGFRAIITIRKEQGHGVLRRSNGTVKPLNLRKEPERTMSD